MTEEGGDAQFGDSIIENAATGGRCGAAQRTPSEDRGLGERCVNFGVPKLGAGYNSYYQIVQTPGHVVFMSEMAHDARIIPVDGRPHLNKNVRLWNGDPRGHWEGDTLVVESTNFSPKSQFRGSAQNLHLVDRRALTPPAAVAGFEVAFIRSGRADAASDCTPELFFTDPDGILIQIQDASYCGGAGTRGNVCA